MDIKSALDTLNAYLDNADTTIDDWDVTEYKDSLIFTIKAPARANRVYIVKGTQVKSYAPSNQTFEDAYSELV